MASIRCIEVFLSVLFLYRFNEVYCLATISVYRPTRNGTFIYFYDATANHSLVQAFDCGWAPEVTYTGYTIFVRFATAPWAPGHSYYVTFSSGT